MVSGLFQLLAIGIVGGLALGLTKVILCVLERALGLARSGPTSSRPGSPTSPPGDDDER
jgi:hypothetical protein